MILCAKCGEKMKKEKDGVTVGMFYYTGYFRADLFCCPKCGNEIISEFGKEIVDIEIPKLDFDFRENSNQGGN